MRARSAGGHAYTRPVVSIAALRPRSSHRSCLGGNISLLAVQDYPQTSPVPGRTAPAAPSTISQVHERLRCGLRAERAGILAFLPLGETKRPRFGIPPYGGILLALCAAYVPPSAGTFEWVGGEK